MQNEIGFSAGCVDKREITTTNRRTLKQRIRLAYGFQVISQFCIFYVKMQSFRSTTHFSDETIKVKSFLQWRFRWGVLLLLSIHGHGNKSACFSYFCAIFHVLCGYIIISVLCSFRTLFLHSCLCYGLLFIDNQVLTCMWMLNRCMYYSNLRSLLISP